MVGLGHLNNFTTIRLGDDRTHAWVQGSAALSIRATASALAPLNNGLPSKDPLLYGKAMRLRPTSISKRPFDLGILCLAIGYLRWAIAVFVYLFT